MTGGRAFHETFFAIQNRFGVRLIEIMANQNLSTVACIALQYEILSVWRLQGEWSAELRCFYWETSGETSIENSVEEN